MDDEEFLQSYYDSSIKNCIRNFYGIGRYYGYLTLIGGAALKYYFPKDIRTLDYDLKFVVNPTKQVLAERSPEDILKESNKVRLDVSVGLVECLNKVKIPENYEVTFILTFVQRRGDKEFYDRVTFDKKNKYKTKLPTRDAEGNSTGKRYVFYYKPDKNFAIRLRYKNKTTDTEGEYSIIDVGLKYNKPETKPVFNYFARRLFNTFTTNEFNKLNPYRAPVPYTPINYIRYPTIEYLLYETFMLLLIYINQSISSGEEFKTLYSEKLAKYKSRIDIILNDLIKRQYHKQIIEQLRNSINNTVSKFEKINHKIVDCYKNGEFFMLVPNINKAECNTFEFKDEIARFETQYDNTLYLISIIREKHYNAKFNTKMYVKTYYEKLLNKKISNKDMDYCASLIKDKSRDEVFLILRERVEY